MVAAGLLARNAIEKGLDRKPWVKSSLAPGSKVVTRYYEQAGLQVHLDALGFNTVGYGCTTCIGNSGPLADEISGAITEGDLVVCSVLSGNRNFEARIHPEVKANYLASPPLVVAYSLAGRMDIDFEHEPIGTGSRRRGRLPARHLAERRRDRRDDRVLGARRAVRRDLRRRVHRRRRVALAAGACGRALRVGARLDLRPAAAVLRGHDARADAVSATSTAHECSSGSATRSRPTTSRPRARSSSTRRPASTCSSTASSARTSTPTARAAGTTR